jgi:hypothetical protein
VRLHFIRCSAEQLEEEQGVSRPSRQAVWQAAGSTDAFVAGLGAVGYATRRDLSEHPPAPDRG